MYLSFVKPTIDFIFSLFLILLFFPVCFLVFLLLTIAYKGNAFFLQERAKKDGKPFQIIKFKTLLSCTRENPVEDEKRLTTLGNFLRTTSLDELPQLINVLKGDMSLVGPRPLLMEYNERYTETQLTRLQVKPGMTGWAQINGGNVLSWEKKFELDVWYVRNLSLRLDVKIFFRTFSYLISTIDFNSKTHLSAKEFTGNLKAKK